jgi:5'-phosphate synthase pdxT subunit
VKIGVLALQGAFREHIAILQKLAVEAKEVRSPSGLVGLDGLIIPGGESTAIIKLAKEYQLSEPIHKMASEGKPVMGTCAGLILLAREITGNNVDTLKLMDISVRRNAFGRQVESFETDLDMPCISGMCHAVFIRAPLIENAGERCRVLATLADGTIVAVKQDNILGLAFHPELSGDDRLHRYFVAMVEDYIRNNPRPG